MSIEPPSLNIPFDRKDHLGYWIVVGCLLFTAASFLVDADFAIVFFASSVVGLPVFFVAIFPGHGRDMFASWGVLGSFAAYLILFGYIAAAKTVLVPTVLSVIYAVLD